MQQHIRGTAGRYPIGWAAPLLSRRLQLGTGGVVTAADRSLETKGSFWPSPDPAGRVRGVPHLDDTLFPVPQR